MHIYVSLLGMLAVVVPVESFVSHFRTFAVSSSSHQPLPSPFVVFMGDVAPDMMPISELIAQAEVFQTEALRGLREASDSKAVEALRVTFLGKKGKITGYDM
jgi:hypothetical protein